MRKEAFHAFRKTVKHGVVASVWFPSGSLLPVAGPRRSTLSWELPSPFPWPGLPVGLHSNAESELPRPLASHLDSCAALLLPTGVINRHMHHENITQILFCLKNASKTKALNDDSCFNKSV